MKAQNPHEQVLSMHSRLSTYFAVCVFIISAMSIIGWQFDIELLKHLFPNNPGMNPLSALCFMTAGISVFITFYSKNRIFLIVMQETLATVPLLVGIVRSSEIVFGLNVPIDSLLFSAKLHTASPDFLSYNMAPNTGFGFILAGIAVICSNRKNVQAKIIANYIAFLIAFISLFSIMGHINQVKEFSGTLKYLPMSIQSGFCFMFLAIAILFKNPDKGFMSSFTSSMTGGTLSRILIPAALIIPFLLGYIRLYISWKFSLTAEFGVTLLETSISLLFFFLIWYLTTLLNREDYLKQRNLEQIGELIHKLEREMAELSAYKYALDESSIVSIADHKGTIHYVNDNFCKISKYTAAELTGQDHRIINSGYHSKEYIRSLWTTIAGGKIWKGELRNKVKDGTIYWVDSTIVPFLNLQGKPYQYLAIQSDITRRKEAEAEQSLLASIISSSDDAIISKTIDSKISSWNLGAEKVFGYSPDEVLGKPISMLIPDDRTDEENEIMRRVVEGQVVDHLETERKRKDGTIVPVFVTVSPVKDSKGNLIGVSKIIRDITDKKLAEIKHAEEESAKTELRFRNTLDKMLEGVQIIGFDWRYLYVNDALTQHAKYSKEELLGYTVLEKYPGIEKTEIYKVYQQCFDKRISIQLENEFKFPDNSKGWFELSFQPVPEGIFILSVDITKRKNAEQHIAELNVSLEQKVIERTAQLGAVNKELETFSYSISHDLRAPLRAVNGYAKMLEEDYRSLFDENAKRLLGIVQENARRMGQLIDGLLTFSRLGRKEIQKSIVNMTRLAETVVEEIKSTQHLAEIKIHELPPARGDKALLKQVILNYLSNAVKYSSKVKSPRIEFNSAVVNQELIYSVSDNGTGFDMNYAHKLFKVFQRLHTVEEFEGTGVGLAIAHRIITKHGGRVWAEGKIGNGATFYFSLPAEPKIIDDNK